MNNPPEQEDPPLSEAEDLIAEPAGGLEAPPAKEMADEDPSVEIFTFTESLPQPEPAAPSALTIHIQSWATPIVGLAMLFIGLLGGFFLRPVIVRESPSTPADSASSNTTPTQQVSEGDRQALMDALVPQVRHFRGSADAPITLIEFSDFQ